MPLKIVVVAADGSQTTSVEPPVNKVKAGALGLTKEQVEALIKEKQRLLQEKEK